jgi:hypothetical protein
MSNKNRPSVLKREREQKKRQRKANKATKAALKRAQREDKKTSESSSPVRNELEGNAVAVEPRLETDGQ